MTRTPTLLKSSPVQGGGGPPKAVEGAATGTTSRANPSDKPTPELMPSARDLAPSTMLRRVPLPPATQGRIADPADCNHCTNCTVFSMHSAIAAPQNNPASSLPASTANNSPPAASSVFDSP